MRIHCPYCGIRDLHEFTYLGAADLHRPDPAAEDAGQRFYDYVYLRDNPAGPNAELWYHSLGCRSWLRVVRNTLDHAISSVVLVRRGGEGE